MPGYGNRWGWGRELDRLRGEIDRVFSGFSPRASEPAVSLNLYAGEDEAVVTAEVPGIDPDALDISVVGRTLTVRGARQRDEEFKEKAVHRREIRDGSFGRTLELPFRADPEKVEANMKHGVLTIRLPRAESDRPRKIAVSTR